MSDDLRMQRTPRAGPVAGLPIDSLVARAEELARHWAIALVVERPLDGLADVPLEDLAREAPALCAQLVRALESDAELERLTGAAASGREDGAPARRLAAMSGARDPAELVGEVETLRGVLWETLLEELRRPLFEQAGARRIADLSDRLAFVCARALTAAIDAAAREWAAGAASPDAAPADAEPPPGRSEREPASAQRAVIVDEREQAPASPRRPQAEIEIRDERGEAGPAAWIGSIGRQLERFRQDGVPFAVLLVELRDIDRLHRDRAPGDSPVVAQEIERALAAELRGSAPGGGGEARRAPWSGSLTRERHGRYWLLAPDTDRAGAGKLAERMLGAIRRLAGGRGSFLEVLVGTAVCPEDGREAAALAAHADVELYAARSSARTAAGRPPASVD
jgi:GGDEF domain-containing protein